jgi:exopolyphosphatase/guanosine-5'-triphosphate,3'-diphosphate pyrophosphatase
MKNYITEEAMERAVVAMQAQIARIKADYCDRIHAFATSAVRNATNADQFVAKMKELFGININVISGDKEALMVYNGVLLAGALGKEKSLIMDIGGGSTEFIIADAAQIYWKRSYELGVSRLLEKFKPSDPLLKDEAATIESYLKEAIAEMIEEVKAQKVSHLIGSSGSFDTFCDVLSERSGTYAQVFDKSSLPFDFNALTPLLDEIVVSSLSQREAMPYMPEYRVRMIVMSALFARLVISETSIDSASISRYSLKEGVLFDVLKGNLK